MTYKNVKNLHWKELDTFKKEMLDKNCICLLSTKNCPKFYLLCYIFKKENDFIIHIYERNDLSNYDEFEFDDFEKMKEVLDYFVYRQTSQTNSLECKY